jgi:hypothetical protein
MAKTTSNPPPAKRTEIADMSVLGVLPLLPGENRADYERLRTAVISAMKPTDFMEKIWTNDFIYLQWEIIRFRHAKANLIRRRAADHISLPSLRRISSEPDTDLASVIAANIGTLETLDGMIAMMEQRRNAAYRQAEQHRINLGNRLRRAVEQVEDAEFRELANETSEEKRAG